MFFFEIKKLFWEQLIIIDYIEFYLVLLDNNTI